MSSLFHLDFRHAALAGAAFLLLAVPARANVIDVEVRNFGFNGEHITIEVGDTVRWTNYDGTSHSATEGTDFVLNGNEAFHNNLPTGQPKTVTFDAAFLAQWPRPGNRYDYFCVPHGGAMRGSITVVAADPGDFFCFCAPFGPCSNRDYGAGCSNSNGTFRGARMIGGGSASVAADDLVLTVDLLPPNKTCLPFRGMNLVGQTQMGEGWRCVGSPFYRLPASNSGASGVVTIGPGIVATTASGTHPILAGQTWHFQVWYRDAMSPCGNATNVSNGYAVGFVP